MTASEKTHSDQARRRPRNPAASSASKPPIVSRDGTPLLIDIALIDEDPGQPRSKSNPGLRPKSIAELAASYGPKGPKTPL